MKTRWYSLAFALILSIGILFTFFTLLSSMRQAAAAPEALVISGVSPNLTQNDLDVSLVITGTGFVDGATARLGATELQEVTWVSSGRLEATLPWGMEPGMYDLTVTNPGGEEDSLPDAMTLEQGIGTWTHATGPEGGEVQLIGINSLTPSQVFVAPQDGGVFRSLDGGENWELSLDKIQNNPYLSFGADGDTVYASTGGAAVDVWRSDDNGAIWNPIPIPNVDGGHAVFAHPTESEVVFTLIGEYAYEQEGLYRSEDRGGNWITVTEGLSGVIPTALAIDALHPLTMALGSMSGEVYLSTDGGNSWSYAAQPLAGRIGWMSFHPSGNGELWVNGYHSDCGMAKSLSPDLSAWTEVLDNGGSICTNQLHLAPLAWGEPYSQTVFYGSYNIRTSADGGLTWNDYGGWPGNTMPVLALHPTDPQTVYVGSTLGMHFTADGGSNWQMINHGLTAIAPEVLEVGDQPDILYGQNEPALGLYRLEGGGSAWSFLPVTPTLTTPMNRSTAFVIDPYDPQHMVLAGYEYIMISSDGGQTWPYTTTLPIPPDYSGCLHYTAKLAFSPYSPGILLAGVHEDCGDWWNDPGGIYLSTDYGETWTQRMANESIKWVRDIAFDWGDPGMVYAVTLDSVLRSFDSGWTWEAVWTGFNHGGLIETEPYAPYRVYVTSGGSLEVSEDQGETWSNLRTPHSGGFGIGPIHFTQGNPGIFYLGQGTGLYFSLDGGHTWKRTAAPLGTGVPWTLSSDTPDERTVLYTAAPGGIYRLTTVPVLLSGVVTDVDSGDPIAGARVQSDAGASTVTDASGAYSLTLPSGSYTLTVGADGYFTQTLGGVELVRQPVVQDFALSSCKVELAGFVHDGYTGLPIEGAELLLNTGESAFSDADGNYSILLTPGFYTVTAQADGYQPRTIGGQDLISGTYYLNFSLLDPAVLPQWAKVNGDGFGDPGYGISVLETFQPAGSAPYLYAGVWGNTGEAKMWRTNDGWNWEIASPSFVTPTAFMMDAQAFNEQLYLGLSSPAQLWRTDGETWQAVDTVGFGDENNSSLNALAVFEDKLYAALLNDVTGLEIWRSSSGDPGSWSQVNEDGFGDWGSGDVNMEIYKGYLYAGFADLNGVGSLWRTNDGITWEPVFTDGLGNPSNGRMAMAEFDGEFYLGFRNIPEGGQIWRSANGVDWKLVVAGGFGEPGNGRPYGMIVADGALYVVFSNPVTGAQVWRTLDGYFWQRVNLDGWGEPFNTFADYNDKGAAVFNFNLYVGTLSNPTGGHVWKLFLSEETRIPLVAK
jgi:photosystem II stability/assembly factor-like uncharacterized protein